jgi:tripartite-type tricarboxylate transporter receptor subunit TctC
MKITRRLFAALLLAAGIPAQQGMAQTFPDKPVKFIMSYPAGGGPDNVMRLVSERLTKMWGQPVLIENRPGGNGWIGIEAAKKAKPDGYTFLVVDAALFCLHPHLYSKLPFDPKKDFEAVAPVFTTNYFIVVRADSPWNNVKDLLDAAKEKKGRLTYGSSGIGSQYHLGGATLETETGVPMTHVPYKETMQIFTDIVGGSIDWSFATASTADALYRAKKLKYLGVAASQRNPSLPDVPTIAEAGGPNMELGTWIGVFSPAGIPKDAMDRVSADFAKIMAEPEIKERLSQTGLVAWSGTSADLQKAFLNDYEKYDKIAKKVNLQLQ